MTKTFPEVPQNPYAMRHDLLRLAWDILQHNSRIIGDFPSAETEGRSVFITADQVIETAQILNEFVSNKGGPKRSDALNAQRCPRCKIGIDTDGDGNCALCANLSDEEVARGIVPGPIHSSRKSK